jgi:DNA invertase Pin-like site-specific DNA recombinase
MKNESNKKITALPCRSAVKNDESIQNQKYMLLDHVLENNITEYEFYIDNGFSGSSLDRPAIKRMIADIKKGRIESVVVTDISRLARDYSAYSELERIFEEHGVGLTILQESKVENELNQEEKGLARRLAL